MANKKKLSFEDAALRLEEIVKLLEKGNASLDESLKLYEEGVALVRTCNLALDNAEKKIKILASDADGNKVEREFLEENDEY